MTKRSLHTPQAKDAKQRCIRNRGERALSFQDFVYLGIVQVTWVTLSICVGTICTKFFLICWFRCDFGTAMLLHDPHICVNVGCLSGCLNCQEPILLLLPKSRCQLVKVALQQESILLRQTFRANSELVFDLLEKVLLVRQDKRSCGTVMD